MDVSFPVLDNKNIRLYFFLAQRQGCEALLGTKFAIQLGVVRVSRKHYSLAFTATRVVVLCIPMLCGGGWSWWVGGAIRGPREINEIHDAK